MRWSVGAGEITPCSTSCDQNASFKEIGTWSQIVWGGEVPFFIFYFSLVLLIVFMRGLIKCFMNKIKCCFISILKLKSFWNSLNLVKCLLWAFLCSIFIILMILVLCVCVLMCVHTLSFFVFHLSNIHLSSVQKCLFSFIAFHMLLQMTQNLFSYMVGLWNTHLTQFFQLASQQEEAMATSIDRCKVILKSK